MSPDWLAPDPPLALFDTLTPIPGPSIPIPGVSATTDEETPVTEGNQPSVPVDETTLLDDPPLIDGHPINLI
jgi:hypothetical protein